MYCNSCMLPVNKDDLTHCKQCGVPLHKSCANNCLVCGKELCDTCYAQNNYKCEDCYKPEDMFPVIRRSHLEQYAGCPYSLYLQLILNITPPMGKAAQLGVIVHELIDLFYSGLITKSDSYVMLSDKIKEWNDSVSKENEEYSTITQELHEAGIICLDNYYNNLHNTFPNDCKSEYNIQFELDENLPKVSCTLDRIVERNGELEIHDWKTGKPMSGQKLITDLQPPLYIWGVFKEFGKLPNSFTLHYIRNNKDIVYERINNEEYQVKTSRNTYTLNIPKALEETKKILSGIENNHFNMPDEKTHQWRCSSMCWYGISGKCAGSFKEQWRVLNGKKE